MRRLLLVRHGPTSATRAATFPADETLDPPGWTAAAQLPSALPTRCDMLCAPEARCRETAQAAGLAVHVESALADCDVGSWAGLALNELDPAQAAAWREDPDAATHGGESLRALTARVGAWLETQRMARGTTAAITHAGVVRAAIVHALSAPLAAFWRLDVAPLSITELHGRIDGWVVTRINHTRNASASAAHSDGWR